MTYRFIKKLTRLEEALDIISKKLKFNLDIEKINFNESLGRVLAENVISKFDIPSLNKSAVDGFAVKGSDIQIASQFLPLRLEIVDEIQIGEKPKKIAQGAIKVTTGSALPEFFDTVIPAEYVNILKENKIEISHSFPIGDNVIQKGEDVKKGKIILRKNRIINPFDIGMLAQLRKTKVKVLEKLKIAILPTGSEIIEPNESECNYKTINTNAYTLYALCSEPWIEVKNIKIVQDDVKNLEQAIKTILLDNHVIITTGGTSVGEFDLVPDVVKKIGNIDVLIRGISIRPGRPTGVAILNKKLIFMLSGFPVACVFGFIALVKPILYKIINVPEPPKTIIKAILKSKIVGNLGVTSYVRVKVTQVGNQIFAMPMSNKGSSSISSLINSNGVIVIPPELEGLDEGSKVQVSLYDAI